MSTPLPAGAPDPLPSRIVRSLPWVLLAACLAFSIHYTRIGWSNPLVDFWAFRETQTAISTRSLLEDGFRFDYATPVLGAPWSIPFEFPTYHFVVAALVKVSGLPLEPAGRWVSLAFGYGSFALAGLFVARASGSRAAGIYTAALGSVSPVYIYGSRAFMMESTALFFTLAMLFSVQTFVRRPRWTPLVWLVIAASLSGLTKATTYVVGLTGVAGLCLLHARSTWALLRANPRRWKLVAAFGFALAVSFGLTLLWTWHTDVLKQKNEFAGFITSAALHDWNFGTWAQRLDLKNWNRIVGWSGEYVLGTPVAWLVGVALLAAGAVRRGFALVLLVTFATGSLVFTNLYLQHQHYLYANGIYLVALFGLGLGGLWDSGGWASRCATGLLIAPLTATLLIWGYTQNSLPGQTQTNAGVLELAAGIKSSTPPGSAMVVYGYDWDSTLPYYAERYALMDRLNLPATDARMQRAMARLDRPLGAVVFIGPNRENWPFVLQQLQGLRAGHRRIFSRAIGDAYAGADGPKQQPEKWHQAGFDDVPGVFDGLAEVSLTNLGQNSGMLVHAPGLLVIERDRARQTLHIGYGIAEAAYAGEKKTDGVTFVVDFIDHDGHSTRLFERRLDPASLPGDRGEHSAELPLPADANGVVMLRTEPGATADFDWSVWRDVRLR